jgi:hypothetical protein
MRRFLLIATLALVVPGVALAKGASEATIEGPGLDGAIVITGDGESGASTLGHLAELAGFFPAVFERTPNPMLDTQPGTDLGARYAVRWVMPGPSGESVIRQDLYPYAKPFPVSYTKPGQRFWDGQRTHGGWYQSTPDLKRTLMQIGIPARAPSSGGGGGMSGWQIVLLAMSGATALALLAGVKRRRRAPAPA